jgi:outer membrane lipoprotein-sorting protein
MVEAKKFFALLCVGCALSFAGSASAQAPASADLQKIIAQLNTASTKFMSAQADFSWDEYQAVVEESDVQTGTISFQRKKSATLMAAQIKQENGKDAPKTIVYDGAQLDFYQPAIKQITTMRSGSNRGQYESFLTLGFGGSGTDLQANWKVTVQGAETIDGVSVVKLDLVPIQQKILDLFTHVTIWVDPVRGISLKQIFYQPSGDKRTAIYKNIRYNEKISEKVFHIDAAPGTTRVVK